MAEGSRKTKREVKTVEGTLKDMTVDMRIFSLTLRSLYVQNAVGTNEEPAKEFRRLRDDTRNDAMVYLRCILPVCTKGVSCISEYIEYYDALDDEKWCEMLPGTLQEITGYKELCSTVLQMLEDILIPLKERKDEALLSVTNCKLKDLQVEYEEKEREQEERAQLPFVRGTAAPLLGFAADSDMAKAVAEEQQAKLQEAASMPVSEALIRALENFIDGIEEAAEVFSRIEEDLMELENLAPNADNDPKKLYHFVTKNEATHMKSACQSFLAVLPDVKTDFLTIPAQGTDQNYVDQWLEKLKETIREKCSVPDLAEKILQAMK